MACVIKENFVGDDSHLMRGTNLRKLGSFMGLYEGASRVVWMHDEHGAGTLRDNRAQRREIDLPAMIINQRIGGQSDVREIGEKFKQRIAWRGNQDFVTRFT